MMKPPVATVPPAPPVATAFGLPLGGLGASEPTPLLAPSSLTSSLPPPPPPSVLENRALEAERQVSSLHEELQEMKQERDNFSAWAEESEHLFKEKRQEQEACEEYAKEVMDEVALKAYVQIEKAVERAEKAEADNWRLRKVIEEEKRKAPLIASAEPEAKRFCMHCGHD